MEEISALAQKIESYLNYFCRELQDRSVGSRGNQEVTRFFAEQMATFGFETEYQQFDCMDWRGGEVFLEAGSMTFNALASPYSLGCDVDARLLDAGNLEDLEKLDLTGSILLIHSELAKEQLMPKNFPFYNPEEHQRIIRLLEAQRPAAIISATTRNPSVAGALYPFPLFEDGDFDIPSVYTTQEEGERLRGIVGSNVSLKFAAQRIPSVASNVIATKGSSGPRVVFCAHIDSKRGTPGALDNASGISVLLALGEVLQSYSGKLGLEIVALNGEDYYSNPGEVNYLNYQPLDEILLGINLDCVGHRDAKTAFSFYNCANELPKAITRTLTNEELVKGEPWYQGDHMIFVLNDRPALAFISVNWTEILSTIAHTDKDTPELVDSRKLATLATSLRGLFLMLGDSGSI